MLWNRDFASKRRHFHMICFVGWGTKFFGFFYNFEIFCWNSKLFIQCCVRKLAKPIVNFWRENSNKTCRFLKKISYTVTVFKIIQNVAFQFFNFGIFHQFLSCLETLFDRKLEIFKHSSNWSFWHFWLTFVHSNHPIFFIWDFQFWQFSPIFVLLKLTCLVTHFCIFNEL